MMSERCLKWRAVRCLLTHVVVATAGEKRIPETTDIVLKTRVCQPFPGWRWVLAETVP
jgi:hypothetical protein